MNRPPPRTGALERMLRRVPLQEIPDGPFAGDRPLARASLEGPENWLLALLEAWARVEQVVGFYQARIEAEGYLATATEELSVYELTRLLGYPARPGVAAAAWVAYTVGGAKEIPREVELPRRARIQSVPVGNQLPQTFELGAALLARDEWSALRPAIATATVIPPLTAGATAVNLAGARTNLKPGASLLVIAELDGEVRRWLRTVDGVEVVTGGAGLTGKTGGTASFTTVGWKDPLDPAAADRTLTGPRVFVLRKTARPFGWNAAEWSGLTTAARREQRPILGGVLVSDDRGGAWRGENEGLPAEPVEALLIVSGELLAAGKAGLYARDGGSGTWRALDQGLGRIALQSLAADPANRLYAGTAAATVYRSTDAGSSWEIVQGRPTRRPLADRLAAALPARWRPPPRMVRLPKGPVRALAFDRRGTLLAAGDSGVFALHTDGTWSPSNRGLPGTDPASGLAGLAVQSLAADAGGIYAGTEKGVYQARRAGAAWKPANRGLPGFDAAKGTAGVKVLALLAWTDRRRRVRYLFAGTDRGIFRRAAGGAWRSANVGLPGTDPLARTAGVAVGDLALGTDPGSLGPWIYAGTGSGVFRSADLGGGWLPLDTGQPAAPVSALAAAGTTVAAATPFDGFAVEQWPDFRLHGGILDLSRVEPEAVPGGWVALTLAPDEDGDSTAAAPAATAILPILDAAVVRRTDYGLSALVTRLTVPAGADLGAFGLRDTLILFDSRALPLLAAEVQRLAPLGPTDVQLADRLDKPLPPQRPLLVRGRHIRARLPAAALEAAADGAPSPLAAAGTVVTVLRSARSAAPPAARPAARPAAPSAAAASWLAMTVRTAAGEERQVTSPEDGLVWLPAAEDAGTVSELAWVAGTTTLPTAGAADGSGASAVSTIVLLAALETAFDPRTVVLHANVAQALQGETIVQTLGSGDARRTNQTFSLTNVPLTYEPAASAAGMRSTLEVRVDGVLWEELPSFHRAGPDTRGYVVHRDLTGRPLLRFGDGVHGARLPSGDRNVQAVYRAGMWTTPLAPDQLVAARTRPLGVRSVTNPLPTAGASPPESLEDLRRRAPRSTRPLARIVSLADFEDFVLTFPGIARARLTELPSPAGTVLQVTVAGIGGRPVESDGNLYRQLVAAIAGVRPPGRRLIVGSYRPVPWRLAARLRPDPAEVAATVVSRVRAALSRAYGFEQARFGQMLASSQVLTLIMEVPGVVDVELTAFYPAGEPPRLADVLHARPARRRGGEIEPAELLLLDDPDGVALTVVTP